MALVAAVGYLGMLVAAALPSSGWLALASLAAAAGEAAMARWAPLVPWGLARMQLGLPWRWAVASVALVAVTARSAGEAMTVAVLVGVAALALASGAVDGFAQVVEHLRKSPVLARGLDLGSLAVPPEPKALLTLRARLLWPAALLLFAGTAAALAASQGEGLAGTGVVVSVLLCAGVTVWAALAALRTRRAGPRSRVPQAVQGAVSSFAPELVLYFGGSADARYQVEMWLPTLEASPHRTLVLVRDREAFRLLRSTTLPVLCIPAGTALVSFDLSTVRGALFVSNAATNIHLIRKGGMRTAFIGHGDSDKASSRSPFTKVYDEIWVAGPAGVQRYAGWETSQVADRIRLVGRPRAGAGHRSPAGSVAERPITVLYAPTWEGWGDEPYHSSLPHLGADILRTLLAAGDVRVLYRPHPLTGSRDGVVRRAHEAVVALLREAGAPTATPGPASPTAPAGDDLSLMTRGARTLGDASGAEDDAAFWAAAPAAHRIVEGWPGLESCFAQSDAMVADVSGVVSDWLAHDRPLAVTDPEGLGAVEHSSRFPSSAAGILVGPGAGAISELLDDLRAGADRSRANRSQVREHLLGSPPETGTERFEAALDELIAVADRESRPPTDKTTDGPDHRRTRPPTD